MRPVLLFDVMDTLVYNPFNAEIPQYFGLSRSQLLAEKNPTAWTRFESGEIDQSEYLRIYFSDGRDFDHAAFLDSVSRAYRWVDGAEPLLRHLCNRGFEIHAFSNYPTWYTTIEARLELSQYLNWTFVSCLTGVRKPAAKAFLGAVRHLDCAVEDCLFIDDNAANCQIAESIGMPAIPFTDMGSLCSELCRQGVINECPSGLNCRSILS